MKNRAWKIIYTNYEGMEKKAVELLSAEVGRYIIRDDGVYTLHVLACEKMGAEADGKSIIVIGKYNENELIRQYIAESDVPKDGYAVRVMTNAENQNIVLITAFNEENLFYAAAYFIDDYLPSVAPVSGGLRTLSEVFEHTLPEHFKASAPKTKIRSIFTWGHPINDYRKYIRNIARMKINQLIIWNDFLPLNAKEVTDYAHEFKIEVIWGFAWGWGTDCSKIDLDNLDKCREDIVKEFKEHYIDAGDGIYFQSFTELHTDRIGDKLIAEAVVDFVSSVAKEIFEIKPELKLQFGLHAMSVREHLEYIEGVDKRIEIIWEDCGCFPYHYLPEYTGEEYADTIEFTDKILSLRNGIKRGVVYKGMMTMDWKKFANQSGPYIMGMADDSIIEHDTKMLAPIWRNFTAEWMNSGEKAWRMTNKIQNEYGADVNLCMAGALDGGVWAVPALCAEMLWSAEDSFEEIRERVLKRPNVRFA